MSFWADRVGAKPPAQAAPAPPAAPAQPASNRPWWMPSAPAQSTAPPVQQPPQQDPGQSNIGELLQQDEYSTTKAQSAKDGERCPDCDSTNYMRSAQQPNSMKQCFDCGYNPRFLHTTHGATGIGQSDLPTHAARAQTLSESNYNPQTIVDRVG